MIQNLGEWPKLGYIYIYINHPLKFPPLHHRLENIRNLIMIYPIKIGKLEVSIDRKKRFYPLVNIQKAIEHGHRNSWFTH